MGRRGQTDKSAIRRQRTEDWETLRWKEYQRNVYRLQRRIYRATRQGDWGRVHKLGCGLPLTTEDVVEIHHRDGDRRNERRANLVLLHAHCHDQAHAGLYH